MSWHRFSPHDRAARGELPPDPYVVQGAWPRLGRPVKHDVESWRVSGFFRDHFELEFYVRKMAKNGVKLVLITQELGDDPMHVMMRQKMALFDEYRSKKTPSMCCAP